MGKLEFVKKRNGEIIPFNGEKILLSLGNVLENSAKKQYQHVVRQLEHIFSGMVPTTAQIRDVIRKGLAKNKKALERFDNYKRNRTIEFKTYKGVRNDLNLPPCAMETLTEHALQRNDAGRIIETPDRLFKRVAKALAQPDKAFGSMRKAEQDFYTAMTKMEFLPSLIMLRNAGLSQQLCQCVALPVEDTLPSILMTNQHLVQYHQSGSLTGINLTMVRPAGEKIRKVTRLATGPVSWAKIYDITTKVVVGGKPITATLSIHHPDSLAFLQQSFETIQPIISLSEEYFDAVNAKEELVLVNPKTRKQTKISSTELSSELHDACAKGVQLSFTNSILVQGQILEAYQALPTGSINLAVMVKQNKPNWNKIKRAIRVGVRMLDNAIDATTYLLPESERVTKGQRRIGLGVTGFANYLAQQNIPYSGAKALKAAEQLAKFLYVEAEKMSKELAKERGGYAEQKEGKAVRNSKILAILNTNVHDIVSSAPSIEPFQYAVRTLKDSHDFLEIHPVLDQLLREANTYDLSVLVKALKKPLTGIPKKVKDVFVTEVRPEFSLQLQAVFQKHCDGGVHKIVKNVAAKDVDKLIKLARKQELKAIHFEAQAL